MKIKSYRGRSLEKLYKTVQGELGANAVVVSSRVNSGALGGLLPFGNSYEVIAVADDESAEKQMAANSFGQEAWERFAQFQTTQTRQVQQMVDKLREDMKKMLGSSLCADPSRAGASAGESWPVYARGWDERFLRKLLSRTPAFFELGDPQQTRRALAAMLRVEEDFPVVQQPKKPHVVVLAGPTGSGKTTTLAKLAAQWGLDKNLKVGLITTDTYRVAAVDQIKEYATLLGVELKIVFSAGEASRAARAMADRDVILVDTAGRNHYDQMSLKGLRGILEALGAFTVLLTVPATLDRAQVPEVLRNYDVLKPSYLVVTKVDETHNYDVLTVAACESACPVAYLTNGQRVPQDIQVARAADLADMLLAKEELLV